MVNCALYYMANSVHKFNASLFYTANITQRMVSQRYMPNGKQLILCFCLATKQCLAISVMAFLQASILSHCHSYLCLELTSRLIY